MNSDTGTIADVLKGLIIAVETWAYLFVVICGLAGLVLAISGAKRLYDTAQSPEIHNAQTPVNNVVNGMIMFVAGAMLTIVAFWSAFFSRIFTL